MSQIPGILEKLNGTSVYDLLINIEEAYQRIAAEQKIWYDQTKFLCPDACGKCCQGFEPDLMEAEALYMAAWLLENQHEIAMNIADGIFPYDNGDKTCPLFNPDSPYHCSIYGGRAFICRLFGASSFHLRDGEKVWRPCRFYPDQLLAEHKPPLAKRQYSEAETKEVIGAVPPLMSDLTEELAASSKGEKTLLVRDVLPAMIKRILWIIDMNDNGNDNPNGSPSGAPLAA
jgi:Fe-S-cluster containining protein